MDNTFDIEGLRSRLRSALEERGISMRQASLNGNCGAGWVHSILEDGKEPTVSKLAAVCYGSGLSLSYIMYGLEVSPETERLISLIEANPEKRDGLLALLKP